MRHVNYIPSTSPVFSRVSKRRMRPFPPRYWRPLDLKDDEARYGLNTPDYMPSPPKPDLEFIEHSPKDAAFWYSSWSLEVDEQVQTKYFPKLASRGSKHWPTPDDSTPSRQAGRSSLLAQNLVISLSLNKETQRGLSKLKSVVIVVCSSILDYTSKKAKFLSLYRHVCDTKCSCISWQSFTARSCT